MWRTNVWLYACLACSVPSSWGMLVYRKLTSKVASIVSLVICNDSRNSTKSLVSLMYKMFYCWLEVCVKES